MRKFARTYNAPDLHAHSTFSLLDGFGTPQAIVERAKELRWGAACLTEHGWMGSAPSFYKACKENKIKPILGVEFYVVPDEILGEKGNEYRSASNHLTVVALSAEGYHNLVRWTTVSMHPENFYYRPRISIEAMIESAPYPLHHNVVMSGCLGAELPQLLISANGTYLAEGIAYIEAMKSAFPNFYIEVQNHAHPKFMGKGLDEYETMVVREIAVREKLLALAKATGTPVVLTNDSHFQDSSQRKAHMAMLASKLQRWSKEDTHHGQSSERELASYIKDYAYWRCVAPATKVLTSQLEWVEADLLHKGDKLLAFDENYNDGGGRERSRRYRVAEIQGVARKTVRCARVFFDNGNTVVVSMDHPWLVRKYPSQGNLDWRLTSELQPGDCIPKFFQPWVEFESKDAGRLAGLFDGEGCVSGNPGVSGFQVVASQNEGFVLEQLKRYTGQLGFKYSLRNAGLDCKTLDICGNMWDKLRFLGAVRPERLLQKVESIIDGFTMQVMENAKVIQVVDVGQHPVVAFQTSTRTFFAEGYGAHNSYLQSMERIEDRTEGLEGACKNALEIVAESNISLDPLDNFTVSIPFSGHKTPVEEIRNRSVERLKSLRRKHGDAALDRFEHELKSMGEFAHYLLMMSDFIVQARGKGILTNTRGSAANSVVCFCLQIHNIDPIQYKLTFERFFNPERKKVPDIDIDIQYDRYDDFMEIVKEYVRTREGNDNLVLLCNYGTLANRSTFRMVAESLGISKEQQDEISQLLPQMIDSGLVDEEEDVYVALRENYPEIYELASGVFDNIKSVGQHACGWLFGTKERPLADWIPRYYIASSGQLVSQYDYKNALLFGLNKGDFLRLKMLKVVADTMNTIGMKPLDLEQIPLDDPETFEMIRAGKTEGIFTLQGKTNRQGVMEVEPENEHGVIASVAIYRPSLTRPGYHRTYNNRRLGKEVVEFPHSVAEEVLGESYGLPIFQEQILDLGYAIGFDHNQAQDLLDAIKLAKGVGRGAAEAFEKIHPVFVERAVKKGLDKDEAEAVWELVGSFQGYGFNRGHATSYGVLAVRASYLKCHHPQEYYVSLLDTYPEKHKYVAAAKSDGFRLLPPSINRSSGGFSKGDDDSSIRVGLARVHSVGPAALKEILRGQPFADVDDLKARTSGRAVKSSTISNLAAVGAFDEFGIAGSDDDTEILKLMGFLIHKPKAMKGCKPKYTAARESSNWRHLGLQRGVDLSDMRSSVSKLFWIPELPSTKLLSLKASAWARVKTYLLRTVDENGLPFDIMANEDKEGEVAYLRHMVKHCRGAVLCLDGSIRKPFDTDGPMGFRFFNVTGAFQEDAQIWGVEDDKVIKYFSILNRRKNMARRKAA